MRMIIATTVLLFIFTSGIYASPVYLSFQGYTGKYYIDSVKETVRAPSTPSEVLLDLAAGVHTFGIDAIPTSEVVFTIEPDGKISYVSNSIAVKAIDTVVGGVQGSKLLFHTTKIFIDASSAIYVLSAHNYPYVTYQTESKNFCLIKGLSYYIATDFASLRIDSIDYPVPESFSFSVDGKGFVHPKDSSLVNLFAATYNYKKLKLNTIPVQINLRDFQTKEITLQGYNPIRKDTTLYFIRSLGRLIKYKVKGVERKFYLIPI